ncbi:MAG: hypothetical protein WBC70_05395 [Candidatus Aminicenantales bacterium]
MMRKTALFSLSFFLLALVAALGAAQETDISGEWQLTIQSPRGPMTIEARFVQEGTKLAVTMTGPRGGESTGAGSIQGQAVRWSISRPTGSEERTVVYQGTVEGTTMSGTADLGERGTVGWTATRT